MTSAPAIGFEYRPSRWLGRVLVPMVSLAVAAAWLSAIPYLLKALVTALLVAAAWRSLAMFVRSPVRGTGWSQRSGWTVRMADGEDKPASLLAFRVAGERMIWLRLGVPGHGAVSMLLAPDNSDADIRRRLRMRLALADRATSHAPGTLPAERGPTV
ncbi:hypothetical protein [Dyella amyloliquefaciens]|uniref:hypothetical protein n=1 Tax=Dyella amyloliquefaciens TaxID=1770545 RepID=UPI00197AA528|nr:hypothetical protein [Dyella amyloliquefaciens]